MQPYIPKTFAGLVAAVSAAILHTPGSLIDAANVALGFIILDTVAGVLTAFVCHEASSHTMRTKLISKSVQYALLVGLSMGASVLRHDWTWVTAAMWAIIGIEALSILETITMLQTHGGVDMGPATGLLNSLSQYFKSAQPKPTDAPTAPAATTSADAAPKEA